MSGRIRAFFSLPQRSCPGGPTYARARLEKVTGGENLAPSLKDVFVPESLWGHSLTYRLPPHLARDSEGNLLPAKRKRGRPLKIREPKALLPSEFEYIAEVNRLRREHVDMDPIVRALENRAASPEILGRAVEEIAIEVAEIKYEIECDENAGRTNLIDRKRGKVVDGCHKIALILLSAAKLGLLEPSPQGARMQRVFRFFLDTVGRVASETLGAPDEFMRRCEASLTGWEDQVESGDTSVG